MSLMAKEIEALNVHLVQLERLNKLRKLYYLPVIQPEKHNIKSVSLLVSMLVHCIFTWDPSLLPTEKLKLQKMDFGCKTRSVWHSYISVHNARFSSYFIQVAKKPEQISMQHLQSNNPMLVMQWAQKLRTSKEWGAMGNKQGTLNFKYNSLWQGNIYHSGNVISNFKTHSGLHLWTSLRSA